MDAVPPLTPKPPGRGLRSVGLVVPGVRRITAQIAPYTHWWSDQNQTALTADGPLLAVIGDSTAIGIGASEPGRGYVGLLRDALDRRDGYRPVATDGGPSGPRWRVINLAQSGARVADAIDRQEPILSMLAATPTATPTVVICTIGTNDVVWSAETTLLRERLRTLGSRLPAGALLSLVAGGSPRAVLANRAIKEIAAAGDHRLIDPWREPGPPPRERLASDRFHPNDLGYRLMTRPFARALGAPAPAGAVTRQTGTDR
ncbi:MAG: SGNH/GDSL hydrolase family protein [Actinomycetota bacterium]